jgi:DNA-binding LytR/AlgR family response regulator
MNSPNILIVEDEYIVAQDMALQLGMAGYKNISVAHAANEAIQKAHETNPDILLLDINLGSKEDGFFVAEQVSGFIRIPVIFVTAYSTREVIERAKKYHPSAYIIKPFVFPNLLAAIEMALYNFEHQNFSDEPGNYPEFLRNNVSNNYIINDFLFIKNGNRFEKVKKQDILYIKADGSYCSIFTINGVYTLSRNLQHILSDLKYDKIIRTHRSYAVNIGHVTTIGNDNLKIENQEIPVSRNHKNELLKYFKII